MTELWELFESLDAPSRFGIFGAIFLLLSAILAYYYYRFKAEVNEITTVHQYKTMELRRLCSDGFNAVVDIEGQVSCDAPLQAPLSGFDCCWYRIKIEREQEHSSKDGTEHNWEVCSDKAVSTIFRLSDETGYVLVDPERADIQAEEPTVDVVSTYLSWFFGVPMSDTGRYRVTEQIFLPGGHAYVLGQATCTGEGAEPDAVIHYPSSGYVDPKRKYFIISRRTENELIGQESISLKICLWLGVVSFMIAAYCAMVWMKIVPA